MLHFRSFLSNLGNLIYVKMIARVARIGRHGGVPELAGLLNETELGINWFVVCRPALSHFVVRFGSFEYVQKLASTIIPWIRNRLVTMLLINFQPLKLILTKF